jgi:hypothetical protein
MNETFLNSSNKISYKGNIGIFNSINVKNGIIENAIINSADITNLKNNKLKCLENILESLIDVSGCEVIGLTPEFKQLICDAVNNYCPYYYCDGYNSNGNGNGVRGINLNNFNLSDNDISFFHEELISDDNFLNDNFLNENYSILDTEKSFDKKSINNDDLITKNLFSDELLTNNNLKIITIDKINKGVWLFNGNICIKIPKRTQMTNLKLFIYLDENLVNSGEIDLGSQEISNSDIIKSFPYNLMFNNDLSGRELKIALISFDNKNEIILLKCTNFFLKML